MEIVGNMRSSAIFLTTTEVINKESIANSDVVDKVEKRYNFAKTKIPKDFANTIDFHGGRFTEGDTHVTIEDVSIGNKGMKASVIGKTETAKKILEEVINIIDQAKIFEKISDKIESWSFATQFKVKLNIKSMSLLSERLGSFLKQTSSIFEKKDFSVEIHPVSISVIYVLKPDLEKLGRELNVSEMSRLLKDIKGKELVIGFEGPEESYQNIYTISVGLDTDSAISLIGNLEEAIRSA